MIGIATSPRPQARCTNCRRWWSRPIESLEGRRLLAAPVVITGTPNYNEIVLSRDSANLVATVNDVPTSYALADITNVQIATSGGYNVVQIDLRGGNPIPSGGLSFNNTPSANPLAAELDVEGSLNTTATVRPSADGAGSITLNDGSTINYAGLKRIALTGQVSQATLALGDAGQTVHLLTDDSGQAVATLDGGTQVSLSPNLLVPYYSSVFQIQGGVGADIFAVDSLSTTNRPNTPRLAIDGGQGADAVVFAAGLLPGPTVTSTSVETIDYQGQVAPAPVVIINPIPINATAGVSLTAVNLAQFAGYRREVAPGEYLASIDWGDGNTTPGSAALGAYYPPSVFVQGDHRYALPGTYTVTVALAGNAPRTETTVTDGVTINTTYVRSLPALATATIVVAPAQPQPVVTPPPIALTPGVVAATATQPVLATLATFPLPTGQALGNFVASVDWGDGSAPVPAILVNTGSGTALVQGLKTYARAGTYPITVAVQPIGGTLATTTTTASVASAPTNPVGLTLAATLDPVTPSTTITNVRTPTFRGTTAPGAQVALTVGGAYSILPLPAGSTTADAFGNWAITTSALADGAFTPIVTATDPTSGSTARLTLAPLVVDATPPTLGTLTVDRARGRFTLTVADSGAGLNLPGLVDPTTYQFRLNASQAPLRLANLAVTGSAGTVVTVSGQLNGGHRLPGGPLRLVVRASGVRDAAGNTLFGGDATVRLPAQRRALAILPPGSVAASQTRIGHRSQTRATNR